MITLGQDVPEFINASAEIIEQLRELIVWEASIPSVFQETRMADRIMEQVSEKQYELLGQVAGYNELREAGDDILNVLRFFVNEGKVMLDCMIESEDGCNDYEIELRLGY